MRKPSDWGQPCPNPAYSQYKLMNRGNVKALSTSQPCSGKRRIVQCPHRQTAFSETRDLVSKKLVKPEGCRMSLKRCIAV